MALSGFMSKVTFVNKVPMLMKATSSDPTPPAGHIYGEIANFTYESLEQNDNLVEFLVDRLKKSSPYIKLKVLLIMKAVVLKGHDEFRKSLCKQAQGIRDARSFSGPPDPLNGDAPYVNVREAAGQLLQVLFDTDRASNESRSNASYSAKSLKMTGFGSSNYGTSSGTNSESSSSAGNSSSQDLGFIGNAIQRVKDNISYTFQENVNAISKYHNPEQKSAENGYQQYDDKEKSLINRPSQTFNLFGGKSENPRNSEGSMNDPSQLISSSSRDWKPQIDSSGLSATYKETADGNSFSEQEESSDQEIKLVESITAAGGIRLNPGRAELQEFVKKCENSDAEKVLQLLKDKLQSSDYKIQMKALFAIESLLNSSISDISDLIFSILGESIAELSSANQTAVKNKASKLSHILKPQLKKADETLKNAEQCQSSPLVNFSPEMEPSSDSVNKTKSAGNTSSSGLVSLLDDFNLQHDAEMSTRQDSESSATIVLGSHDELASNNFESRNIVNSEVPTRDPQSSAMNTDQTSMNLLDLDPLSMVGDIRGTSCAAVNKKAVPTNSGQSIMLPRETSLDPFAAQSVSSVLKVADKETTDPRSGGFSFMSAESNSLGLVTSSQIIGPSPVNCKGPDKEFCMGSKFDFMGAQNNDLGPNASNRNIAGLPFAPSTQGEQTNGIDPTSGFNFMDDQIPVSTSRNIAATTQMHRNTLNPSVNNQAGSRDMNTSQGRTAQLQNYNVQRTSTPQGGQYKSMNTMNNSQSNQTSSSSNGFGFISGGKKAGAFDFVKDAMEASKKQ
eukprot:Seg1053.6 transcript_id=Seg1053.6/GoldUCD/mRNA.D3Y31 product="AP-4 complex accessory subunit tepsin" protein_id=Seg1053.6/GoldUCD/D3Y31